MLKTYFCWSKGASKVVTTKEGNKYVFKGVEGGRVVIESSLQFNYEALKVRLIVTKLEFYIGIEEI